MVHSASVEDNMGKHQQPVPVEEIIPADTETEIQRSVPLPPPIIPETEDFSPSSVSDTSSGYMSTSISTATLSDIYTLSWDLPAPSSSRGGPFEAVPDEEEEEKTVTEELSLDQSEPQETMLNLNEEAVERRDQKPNDTPSHLETNRSSSVQLKEEEEPDPGLGDQTKENQNSTTGNAGSEALNNSETHTDSVVEKNTESRQESSTEDQQLDNRTRKECEPPLHNETQHSDQVGDSRLDLDVPQQPEQDHTGSDNTQDPAPEPNGDSALQISPNKPLISETSDPISTSVLPPSSITHETQQVTPSDSSTTAPPPLKVQPPKSGSSAANPFKIQKVKSSDLKSFQRMVGEEGGKPAMVDRASSLGAGLNLSVPMESLEIISDSEEGDEAASAVLPDWLKEGEFVTVGTNKSGTVRYVGPTDFAAGTWVGVELEVPAGKNDGSVGGKHYFHCNPGYGVLVRPDRVARGGAKRRRQQQKRQSANLSGSSPNLAALTALAKGETGPAGRNKGENRKSWNT